MVDADDGEPDEDDDHAASGQDRVDCPFRVDRDGRPDREQDDDERQRDERATTPSAEPCLAQARQRQRQERREARSLHAVGTVARRRNLRPIRRVSGQPTDRTEERTSRMRHLRARSRAPHAFAIASAVIAGAAMFAVAACGTTSPSVSPGIGTVAPTTGPGSGFLSYRAYFILGSFGDNPGLVPVERVVVDRLGGAIEGEAIKALLAGPNDVELGGRPAMFTDIPPGARLLDLSVAGETATVDLSGEFDDEGRAGSFRARLAQVVFTLTQFPGITSVLVEIDGKGISSFGSEVIAIGESFDRTDFADHLPAIFVDRPAWGTMIPNPVRLSGSADVFEATFHVRIVDAGGHSLADGPVMATCGSGCRGTFDVAVPYGASAAAPATLQVYELSAADGSIINLTEYPVTLTPAP